MSKYKDKQAQLLNHVSLLLFFQGWTKPNAFHVCITSYKLVLQDHQAFRRKSWRYLILDEAQNIKNFKSQRWQSLLNFNRSVGQGGSGSSVRCC